MSAISRFLQPTFLHGIVMLLGGIAFAVFGCLGQMAGWTSSPSTAQTALSLLGVAGVLAGCLAAVVGGLLLIIAIFNALFGKRDTPPPSSQSPR